MNKVIEKTLGKLFTYKQYEFAQLTQANKDEVNRQAAIDVKQFDKKELRDLLTCRREVPKKWVNRKREFLEACWTAIEGLDMTIFREVYEVYSGDLEDKSRWMARELSREERVNVCLLRRAIPEKVYDKLSFAEACYESLLDMEDESENSITMSEFEEVLSQGQMVLQYSEEGNEARSARKIAPLKFVAVEDDTLVQAADGRSLTVLPMDAEDSYIYVRNLYASMTSEFSSDAKVRRLDALEASPFLHTGVDNEARCSEEVVVIVLVDNVAMRWEGPVRHLWRLARGQQRSLYVYTEAHALLIRSVYEGSKVGYVLREDWPATHYFLLETNRGPGLCLIDDMIVHKPMPYGGSYMEWFCAEALIAACMDAPKYVELTEQQVFEVVRSQISRGIDVDFVYALDTTPMFGGSRYVVSLLTGEYKSKPSTRLVVCDTPSEGQSMKLVAEGVVLYGVLCSRMLIAPGMRIRGPVWAHLFSQDIMVCNRPVMLLKRFEQALPERPPKCVGSSLGWEAFGPPLLEDYILHNEDSARTFRSMKVSDIMVMWMGSELTKQWVDRIHCLFQKDEVYYAGKRADKDSHAYLISRITQWLYKQYWFQMELRTDEGDYWVMKAYGRSKAMFVVPVEMCGGTSGWLSGDSVRSSDAMEMISLYGDNTFTVLEDSICISHKWEDHLDVRTLTEKESMDTVMLNEFESEEDDPSPPRGRLTLVYGDDSVYELGNPAQVVAQVSGPMPELEDDLD